MHVLLTANHRLDALASLCVGGSVAGLVVVGRSVLERTLDAVAPLAPSRVIVATSGDVVGMRALVSAGERWGVEAKVVSAKSGETAESIIARLPELTREGLLVVPCDRLYDLELVASFEGLVARSNDGQASVRCEESGLAWHPFPERSSDQLTVRLPDAKVLKIDSPSSYHDIARSVSRGDHARMAIAGRQQAVGLRHGYMTKVHPCSVSSGHVFLGNYCRVHPTCRFTGTVVVEHGVSIGRMTHVENSIVLANTVVGEHLNIRDSIVSGNTIVRVSSGAVLQISDRFLLSERGSLYGEYLSTPSHRILGLLLLIGCSPLLLAGLAAASLKHRGRPMIAQRMLGNCRGSDGDTAREFTARSLNLDVPLVRRLPMLLAVVSGDLRLFGVAPLTRAESETRFEDWESVRDGAAVGLAGPTQLYLGLDAPLAERLLSDAIVARTGLRASGIAKLGFDAIRCTLFRGGQVRQHARAGDL